MFRTTIFLFLILHSLTNAAGASLTQRKESSTVNQESHYFEREAIAQVDAKTAAEARAIILELGLTEEQIARLSQVGRKFNPQFQKLNPSLNDAQAELEALITSEDASESEIREKYQEVASLNQKLSELYFERRMAVRAILRPEQRLPYAQYIEQKVAESRAKSESE